ncbi:MAG TPA: hypothetical protein VFI22_09235, partial [Thermomicrobiales bacterium]|nr:hypothetical protein [Thermomicrobiales bacterium]
RVKLAGPAITVSIAQGGIEMQRVSADLDDRGRFSVTLPQPLAAGDYTLAINDLAVGNFAVGGEAMEAAPAEQAQLLDIARIVPYPVDFGGAIPGLGFLDGRFYSLQDEAARTAAAAGEATAADVRDTRRQLAESGWLQRYENRLAAPTDDDPDTFRVQVSSFVVEYASGDDAHAAYETLIGQTQGEATQSVGDESTLTLLTGVTPDTNAAYQAARLVFRVDTMLAVIIYADLLDQTPDLALLQAVAQNVAGRAVVVAARESLALGGMALRLDPSTATGQLIRRDLYDVRAGVLTPLYGEDDDARANRIDLLTGTTDAFSTTMSGTFAQPSRGRGSGRESAENPTPTPVIGIEGQSAAPAPVSTPTSREPQAQVEDITAQVFMISALYAFPGEGEADAWLTAQTERLLSNPAQGTQTFTAVADAPRLGDGSATFATERPTGTGDETAQGFRIYARLGAIVAALEIGSVPGVELNGAARLMATQIDCIAEGGCIEPAPLPASIFGGKDQSVPDQSRRTRAPSAAPAPTKAPRPARTQAPPAPIEAPTPIPIEEPTAPPAEEPAPIEETPSPVEEPTPPPSEATPPPPAEATPPPVEEPTAPPVEDGTPPPAAETPPPAEETPPPVEETPLAGEEPTSVPVEEPTPGPGAEPTVAPTAAPTAPP